MEHYTGFFFILLMFSKSYCEECITYDFEEGFDEIFTPESSYICREMRISTPWTKNNYSSIGLESPHPSSTIFITPSNLSSGLTSCVSSFEFVTRRGILELTVYQKNLGPNDFINILISLDGAMTSYFPDWVEGWNNLRLTISNDIEKKTSVSLA